MCLFYGVKHKKIKHWKFWVNGFSNNFSKILIGSFYKFIVLPNTNKYAIFSDKVTVSKKQFFDYALGYV